MLNRSAGPSSFVRLPFALTARGLVWAVTTETGLRVLEFPPVETGGIDAPGGTELRVWKALERVQDSKIARVELEVGDSFVIPFVALTPACSEESSGFEFHSSNLLISARAVSGVLDRVGLRFEDIPSALVVTCADGQEQLVCCASRLLGARGWTRLSSLISSRVGDDSLTLPPPPPT